MVASVAIVEDGITKAEYTINNKKTHSQTLLPMLDEVARMLEEDMSDVDAVAIAAGPGSFTGLRIGSATVKGLAMAYNKPIVEVSTLAGLAANMWGTSMLVCPVMDARRNQTYTGIYEYGVEDNTCVMKTILDECALSIEALIDKINEQGKAVVFLGDGVPVFKDKIKELCKVPFVFAPANMNRQRAASVAMLGELLFKEGKSVSATEHVPEYLRLSQAERERLEQGESIV